MTYLSRVPINPMRRRSQWLLDNPQRMHAQVLHSLPTQPVRERTLWRREDVADADGVRRRVNLLVLTATRPSWAEAVHEFGWPDTPEGEALVREYEPVLDHVQLGRELAFRVTANPSVITHQPTPKERAAGAPPLAGRGARLGHRSAPHQLDWFLSRAAGSGDIWGFTVGDPEEPHVRLVARERLSFQKAAGGPKVVLETATFDGVLRITDTSRFREVLLGGLGRGKAYGCGLLTVTRPGGGHVVAG